MYIIFSELTFFKYSDKKQANNRYGVGLHKRQP